MSDYSRYAVFLIPDDGALSRFGAQFLGWDVVRGARVAQPETLSLPRAISELTATPAKYGFHGTIKPPMRLSKARDRAGLLQACRALLAAEDPVVIRRLRLARIGSFFALVPATDARLLSALAGRVVAGLDPFRAPMTDTERARRNPDRLSDRQRSLLDRWGYPYVMEEFRFHMTLTGRLSHAEAGAVEAALAPVLTPILTEPLEVTSLCVCGERPEGQFEMIERIPLGG